MKIVADSAIPFLRGVFEPWAEVVYLPGVQIGADAVRDADALIVRTRTRCNEALLANSRVRLVATATIGFDHIDTAYCRQQGIEVATAAGCNARGVLQWVAATLVHLSRQQGWQPQERTLGIVGVGNVGSLVDQYARLWGFRTICCDPPRQAREGGDFHTIEELAAAADIITFHTPLDSSTYHLANAALLARCKPEAVLLNSSRGEVVDSQALLQSHHPFALDVWEGEPHLDRTLLNRALLATPHIAGYSEQGKATATAMAVAKVAKTFNLPLQGWYPPQALPSNPQQISWLELCKTIDQHYNIDAESLQLKSHPEDFETLRDNYCYRCEYF